HRHRGRVPTGVGRSSFVEMKRLWIEFGGKALDPVDIDADALGSKRLSRFKIFQVSLDRIGHGVLLSDYFANAGVRGNNAVSAPSRRFFRMPSSTRPAGANLRSSCRKLARPPAG